jgi:hypothetical protein
MDIDLKPQAFKIGLPKTCVTPVYLPHLNLEAKSEFDAWAIKKTFQRASLSLSALNHSGYVSHDYFAPVAQMDRAIVS